MQPEESVQLASEGKVAQWGVIDLLWRSMIGLLLGCYLDFLGLHKSLQPPRGEILLLDSQCHVEWAGV